MTPPLVSPLSSRRLWGVFYVGLLLGAASAGPGCGGCNSGAPEFAGLVPEDAPVVLRLPAPSQLQPPLRSFLSGLGDSEGVYALIEGRYGVDLASPEGVAKSGLDPESPAYLWWTTQGLHLAVGTTGVEKFEALLVPRLRGSAFGAPQAASGDNSIRVAHRDGGGALAWSGRDGIVILCQTAQADAAGPCVRDAWSRKPGGPSAFDSERFRAAMAGLDVPGATADLYVDVTALTALNRSQAAAEGDAPGFALPSFGPLDAAIAPALELADTVGIRMGLADDRVSVRAALRAPADRWSGLLPYLKPAASAPAFGTMLPRDAPLFIRFHVDLSPFRGLGGWLLGKFVPDSVLAGVHPLLRDVDVGGTLVKYLTGDVAVAGIGLVEGRSLDRVAGGRTLRGTIPHVDAALLLRSTNAAALWESLAEEIGPVAEERGYSVEVLPGVTGGPPGVRAVSKTRKNEDPEVLSAWIANDTIVVTSGERGYADARGALEGRITPLAKRPESENLAAVVAGAPLIAGGYLSFFRLSRELAERGAPPFFLRLLDSIFEMGFRVTFDSDALLLEMEVVQ